MKGAALKLLFVCVFMVAVYTSANAQSDDIPPDPDEIPLDPGSWVLVAAGVGYGVKKWKDSKQKTNKGELEENTAFLHGEINQNNL